MKPSAALLLGALFATAASAQTAQSVGLYNTGALVNGITNPYTITGASVAGTFGLYEPLAGVYPLNGAWLANTPDVQWLAFYSGNSAPGATAAVPSLSGATYNVGLTFNVTGISYQAVAFDIAAAVDNNLVLRLNGAPLTNLGSPAADGDRNYNNLSHYRFQVRGTNLQAGSNTLDFAVTNISGPAGLYVQYSNFAVIPEPSTYALIFGIGTLGLAFLRRRCRR